MGLGSDELQELLAERDRLDARIAGAVAAFDWEADGATSMQAWLRDRGRMTHRAAAQLVARARRTAELSVTAAAWADGSLSTGQVDVVLANVRTDTALFSSHESSIIPSLVPLSINDTATVMQHWRERADATAPEPDLSEPPSRLHLSATLDGRGALDGDLDADGHAIVATALRVATTRDTEGEPVRTAAERRADALVDVCRFFLDNQHTRRGGRHRPHVNLLVDLESNGRVLGGPKLPKSVTDRYCCDSTMHRVLTDGRSTILDLGVATRVVSAALWVAVVTRDEHCRFPGCDRPSTWCDAHHVRWVRHGGATRLDNLVLLCRRHHTLLHKPGWHAKLLPDGELDVTDPDGRHRTSRPPGALEPFP